MLLNSSFFSTCLAPLNTLAANSTNLSQKSLNLSPETKALTTETDIRLAWFSGTGNTIRALKAMKEQFERRGKEVTLFPIEKSTPKDFTAGSVKGKTAYGALFCVHAENPNPFVWKYFEGMQNAQNNEKVFVLDTLMMMSGGVIRPMKKLFESKGYLPVGAAEILYPSNMLFFYPDSYSRWVVYPRQARKVRRYTDKLIQGTAQWNEKFWKTPKMTAKFEAQRKDEKVWKRMPNAIKIDKEKCVGCNICVSICPTNALKLDENQKVEKDKNLCLSCQRCVGYCPSIDGPVFAAYGRKRPYRAIPLNEMKKYIAANGKKIKD